MAFINKPNAAADAFLPLAFTPQTAAFAGGTPQPLPPASLPQLLPSSGGAGYAGGGVAQVARLVGNGLGNAHKNGGNGNARQDGDGVEQKEDTFASTSCSGVVG
jgi:hypothetical protein